MNYKETLEYIHSVSWLGSRPGLERITELCARLGNPEDGLKFVHVTGTNGKGSTCSMTESILRHAGYKTGLFTSPFVKEFNERIAINGLPVSNELLARATETVKAEADKMKDSPTEFELITAIAMVIFKEEACDVVILEVGMGGRLDSTNIIKSALLSVVTGISLDHTAILGDSIEKIATEKAGIIKKGCPVLYGGRDFASGKICLYGGRDFASGKICLYGEGVRKAEYSLEDSGGEENTSAELDKCGCEGKKSELADFLESEGGEAFAVIEKRAREMEAPFFYCNYDELKIKSTDLSGTVFDYKNYKNVHLSLLGLYQPENAVKAIEAAELLRTRGLKITDTDIYKGLENARWPARFEKLSEEPLVIYDGSHNPEGIAAAERALSHYFGGRRVNLLTGVMADKDYTAMAESLAPHAKKVFTVTPNNPRSLKAERLAALYRSLGVDAEGFDTVYGGFKKAYGKSLEEKIPLICLGSLYMYCEVAESYETVRAEAKKSKKG